MKTRRTILLAIVAAAALAPHTALAQTRSWVHSATSGFPDGEKKSLIITSGGDMRLARAIKTLIKDDGKTSIVSALAEAPDGTLYVGTSLPGRILALKPNTTEPVVIADLGDDTLVSSLLVDSTGRLLAGTGGDESKLLRYPPPAAPAAPNAEPESLLTDEDTENIYALRQSPTGEIYIATGPDGKLFVLKPNAPTAELLFDFEEDNLLSLALDTSNNLFIGTDPRGWVYRLALANPNARPTVLFDAPEPEIIGLAIDSDGNLLVAAGAPSTGSDSSNGSRQGHPDTDGKGDEPHAKPGPAFPDPTAPPSPPAPPALPGQPPTPEPKEPGASLTLPFSPNGALPALFLPPGMPIPSSMSVPVPDVADAPEGSALYRIDPAGFPLELYRGEPTIYAMLEKNGVVLLGTGSQGTLIQVDTRRDETSEISRTDGSDITALLQRKDGSVALGVSHGGSVATLSPDLAAEGTFTSSVLDATHAARFGTSRFDGTLPADTSVLLSTRSGNTDEPTDSAWEPWTTPVPAARFVPLTSPPGRFLQYRLTFTAGANSASPLLRELEIAYRIPNMPPQVASISVGTSSTDPDSDTPPTPPTDTTTPSGQLDISWDATDPNDDTLLYSLALRPVGEPDWRPIKDRLDESTYPWNSREVPDGRYQIRVIADDAPSNVDGENKKTARVSPIFLVDHTPPQILTPITAIADGVVTLKMQIKDAAGIVKSTSFRVGAAEEWRNASAGDKLFDSPSEDVTILLRGLAAGRHVVRIRATDENGNEGFETILVDVPAAK